jgi:succinate dehydrogenase / fumarate reductase iron-sulfur subunit
MKLTLKIWRQNGPNDKGRMETYPIDNIDGDMSFLEMLDILNDELIEKGESPVAFDHDCREGICGMCSLYINGEAHGPDRGVTTCQLHMRKFKDGETIYIEPWRAKAFPVIKDLVVDRSAFDRIMASGGFVSVNTSGMQMLFQFQRKMQTLLLRLQPALDVVHVLLRVRMLRQCCSFQQRSLS